MDIKEEIINSIDIMVQKAIEKSNPETTRRGVVTGMENGKYQVSIDGTEVSVYDSVGCNPKIGDGVFVQTPNGSLINAFITGLLKSNAKGGGGTDVIPNPPGEPTDDLDTVQIAGTIYEVMGGAGQQIISVGTLPSERSRGNVYLVRGDLAIIE